MAGVKKRREWGKVYSINLFIFLRAERGEVKRTNEGTHGFLLHYYTNTGIKYAEIAEMAEEGENSRKLHALIRACIMTSP